ncbi:hypothetical protein [Natrinema sp. 1APR25-10V2]|uniref:hypothetical protein n=1 Tax=Natrinema sp. 1APR25-10V2 TaxID=2951081 RepID=UPI0028770446|nr:hypothetical protein [Natrinema sp. 1APR25-10V2]MDS0474335.1 hypothetical protein [Natrinema sp. 1APR25-10V2]
MEESDKILLRVPDRSEAEALLVGIHHKNISAASRVEINRAIMAVAADNPDLIRKEVEDPLDVFDL